MNANTNDVLTRILQIVEGDPGMERTAKLKNPPVGKAKTAAPASDKTVKDELEAEHPHEDDGVHKHMESLIAQLRRSLSEQGDPGKERTAKLKNPEVGAAKTMGPDSDETVADDIEADDIEADSKDSMESVIARLRRSLAEQEDKAGKQRTAGLKLKPAAEMESESEADEDSIADDLQGKHKGASVGKATKTMEAKDGKAKCCRCEAVCGMDEMHAGEEGPMCGECWSGMGEARSLSDIAIEIRKDWKSVNYAAEPYLDAMSAMDSIDDDYGADSGRSVVAYFLSNAQSWKGPKAKEIKAELKKMMKEGAEAGLRTNAEVTSESGEKFKKLVQALADRGAENPKALAAWIGRKKYGKAKFQQMAAAGRKK